MIEINNNKSLEMVHSFNAIDKLSVQKTSENEIQWSGNIDEGFQKNKFVFWGTNNKIVPHRLYEFLESNGIGKYYPNENRKNSNPVIVKVRDQIVSEVNVGHLIEMTKNFILECTPDKMQIRGEILDSLLKNTSLFGEKNLHCLKSLQLEFISDTKDCGYLFFRNGVVQVTKDEISIKHYAEFNKYVWERSIKKHDFEVIDFDVLKNNCDFMGFIHDLSEVDSKSHFKQRLDSLKSTIGYLLHRYKDGTVTKGIIFMDVFVNGQSNGGSGKSLLLIAIGKIRILAIIDGKKYDKKEWFGLSGIEPDTEIVLFDDLKKDFDFEHQFSMMTNGMDLKKKGKNDIHISHENTPKMAFTTNYAVNGYSSSFKRRKFEYEVSPTYSADFTPLDKYKRVFFEDWKERDWNMFYNTMLHCLQVYLKDGLIESEPINIQMTKIINCTNEDFVEWAEKFEINKPYQKNEELNNFIIDFPEYKYQVRPKQFTGWLKYWAEYKQLKIDEWHSGSNRYFRFMEQSKRSEL